MASPLMASAAHSGGAHLPAALSLAVAVSALGLLVWLPAHVVGEHRMGPQLQLGTVTWWLVAAVLVAQSLLLSRAARGPARALLLVAGVPLLLVLAPVPVLGLYTLSVIAEAASVFFAVAKVPLAQLRAALAGAASLITTGQLLNGLRSGDALGPASVGAAVGQAAIVMGLPLLLGALVAARRAVEESSRRRLDALRAEQEALLTAAIARQRLTMSRELHDIAAHHLSGVVMLATAMKGQIDTDPVAARSSADQVREQSRSVLSDLHRLVGLLREDAEAAAPVQTIDALRAVVGSRRVFGADVELRMSALAERRASEVGPLAQLVVHRMVQESLSNAAAHAPGAPCTVVVGVVGDDLEVVVSNGAADSAGSQLVRGGRSSGFGLVGMTERAQLVSGTLSYGPTQDGGWCVRLTVPIAGTTGASLGSNGAGGAAELRN